MNLANKIESDQLTMVNFHATWCPPCVVMKPNLEEVNPDAEKDASNALESAVSVAKEFFA